MKSMFNKALVLALMVCGFVKASGGFVRTVDAYIPARNGHGFVKASETYIPASGIPVQSTSISAQPASRFARLKTFVSTSVQRAGSAIKTNAQRAGSAVKAQATRLVNFVKNNKVESVKRVVAAAAVGYVAYKGARYAYNSIVSKLASKKPAAKSPKSVAQSPVRRVVCTSRRPVALRPR